MIFVLVAGRQSSANAIYPGLPATPFPVQESLAVAILLFSLRPPRLLLLAQNAPPPEFSLGALAPRFLWGFAPVSVLRRVGRDLLVRCKITLRDGAG